MNCMHLVVAVVDDGNDVEVEEVVEVVIMAKDRLNDQ